MDLYEFNLEFYCKSFERNKNTFREMLFSLPEVEYRWREAVNKWNILEIVCHLYDEEREDFRRRLKSVLENPDMALEAIDPVGWVLERKYSEQEFSKRVEMFLEEREKSIEWIKTLEGAAWENAYQHPELGPLSGKFVIANWLAHDFLHIRQITRVKYRYLEKISGQQLNYAGDW